MPTPHAPLPCPASKLARCREVVLLAVLALPCAVAGAAEPDAWSLDPVHTRVMFAVSHAGFSKALGTVSGSEGVLLFDPDDWSSAQLQVTVPLAQLELGDADWNEAVLASGLLDARTYPSAYFRSTTVTGHDATHARVCGELTLHAVTRPLCLDVVLNAIKRHPMPPFRRTVGFSATATLSRSDFGIDAWPSMIGDEVGLRIEAEAVHARRSTAAELLQPPPPETIPETLMPETPMPILPTIPPVTELGEPTRTQVELQP
ncbi:YceI family protein [Lysobacter sp. A378]